MSHGNLPNLFLHCARLCLILSTLAFSGALFAATNPVMQAVHQRISVFHQGEKANNALVRVVYFHAADRAPLADYAARLDRCLTDVSAFYREGMEQRFGVKITGLPFERDQEGKLVVHVVKGRQPAAKYTYESGDETWGETRKALAGKINPDKEHILILYGLCEREPEGRYVFNAPYYGANWSDHRRGLCHAADCELLDPALLTRKDQPFVFKEHYYERMKMSVAQFNSWYLGGIAHELGHGLGFPHDNGAPGEARGAALMGGGNLNYRETAWGGEHPSYLSLATALRLAAHPLVTRSDKARWQTPAVTFESVTATVDKGKLRLTGQVRADVPPCAIIASAWPTTAKSDHGATTFCAAVDDDGKFSVELSHLKAPAWNLNLGCLMVNGAEVHERLAIQCNSKGEPSADEFNAAWILHAAEQTLMRNPAQADKYFTDAAIVAAPTKEAQRRLRLLAALRGPEPKPVDLLTAKTDQVFLSDAQWTEAKVGWGEVMRNRYCFNSGRWQGMLLRIKDEVFAKGLYAHSTSTFTFSLGGKWRTFTATIGLQDGAADQGSAIFTVRGDGRELFRSKIFRVGQKDTVRINISGVKKLELRAEGAEGHNHNSWAIWADPLVER